MAESTDALKAIVLPRVLAGEDINIVAAELGLTIEQVEAIVASSGGAAGQLWVKERRLALYRAAEARILSDGEERSVNDRRRREAELRFIAEQIDKLQQEITALTRKTIPIHTAVPRG